MPSTEQILKALESVIDPELRQDIVTLGMVRRAEPIDDGTVAVTVSLTTPGCPIRSHFETAVVPGRLGARRRPGRRSSTLTSCRTPRRATFSASSAAARCRRARWRRSRTSSASARARAASASRRSPPTSPRRWPPRARRSACSTPTCGATRSRACSASARRSPTVNASRKIVPLDGEGGVKVMSIGFFVAGGLRRRMARPDAAQGADAVPRGRRVGRARLPAARPAAGHRRRLDDARPAAAAGEVPDRHDATADRAEGRAAQRRDGATRCRSTSAA